MRIEISTGGLGIGSISDMQSEFSSYISDAEGVISSFKTIQSSTCNLNGGIGNLQEAIDSVASRIQTEESKLQDAKKVQAKTNSFIDLAVRVDKSVARMVDQNKEEFYQLNSWLKPSVSNDVKFWSGKVWEWLCDTAVNIAEGVIDFEKWKIDTLKKFWDSACDFYNEHKEVIWKIAETALIVIGAVATIVGIFVTGGFALGALVPFLTAIGFSSGVAFGFSSVVAGIAVLSTLGSSALNVIDIWAEIDSPGFNAWQLSLNVASMLTTSIYSAGGLYNEWKGISPQELNTFRKMKYTKDEIQIAVTQDVKIKHFAEELAKTNKIITTKGNYGEMYFDKQMRMIGYKRISDKTVVNYVNTLGTGIDGVYANKVGYVIGESKYGTSALKWTRDGQQMSTTWIQKRLSAAVGLETANNIFNQGYSSLVFRVDKFNPAKFALEFLE